MMYLPALGPGFARTSSASGLPSVPARRGMCPTATAPSPDPHREGNYFHPLPPAPECPLPLTLSRSRSQSRSRSVNRYPSPASSGPLAPPSTSAPADEYLNRHMSPHPHPHRPLIPTPSPAAFSLGTQSGHFFPASRGPEYAFRSAPPPSPNCSRSRSSDADAGPGSESPNWYRHYRARLGSDSAEPQDRGHDRDWDRELDQLRAHFSSSLSAYPASRPSHSPLASTPVPALNKTPHLGSPFRTSPACNSDLSGQHHHRRHGTLFPHAPVALVALGPALGAVTTFVHNLERVRDHCRRVGRSHGHGLDPDHGLDHGLDFDPDRGTADGADPVVLEHMAAQVLDGAGAVAEWLVELAGELESKLESNFGPKSELGSEFEARTQTWPSPDLSADLSPTRAEEWPPVPVPFPSPSAKRGCDTGAGPDCVPYHVRDRDRGYHHDNDRGHRLRQPSTPTRAGSSWTHLRRANSGNARHSSPDGRTDPGPLNRSVRHQIGSPRSVSGCVSNPGSGPKSGVPSTAIPHTGTGIGVGTGVGAILGLGPSPPLSSSPHPSVWSSSRDAHAPEQDRDRDRDSNRDSNRNAHAPEQDRDRDRDSNRDSNRNAHGLRKRRHQRQQQQPKEDQLRPPLSLPDAAFVRTSLADLSRDLAASLAWLDHFIGHMPGPGDEHDGHDGHDRDGKV